jgi:hemoglobin
MKKPPSLYEWIGGAERLEALFTRFYDQDHVFADPLLKDVFAHMGAEHPKHVALFVGEIFGGPKAYTEHHGGHAGMIRHHMGRHLSEAQRQRWLQLLLQAADEIGVPDDPEFRSAFVAYLEWGTRLAVINSQQDPATTPDTTAPMPKWDWGVPGGPYQPE